MKVDELRDAERRRGFRASTAIKRRKPVEPGVWGLNNPEDYYRVYGRLPELDPKEPLKYVFANGPSRHHVPLISRGGVEIFPRMYSTDEPVLRFQRWLRDELNLRFPADLDADGFSRTGVHATFDTLCSVAGWYQNPMSFTPVDNAEYRKSLGLSEGYTERQKAIALEFWRLVFSSAHVSPVNVSKLSTGGMRRFTSSVQWKLDYANFVLQPSQLDQILNLVAGNDWLTLANDYEMVFATYIQKRGQVDSAGKVREAMDLEYALSGGARGRVFPTDKKVVINGVPWDDFSAIRARVVHAGPWAINCILQVAATVSLQSLFLRFPKTFHVNTPEEIKSRVDGKYVYCSDVKEYDRSMSRDAIDVVHEAMREYWDERLVKMSDRLFKSPYYAKPLDIEGKRGTWVGDPTDWTQQVFAGNRSGHAFTSLVAKGNKVVETLFVIDRLYPVLGRVRQFLDHQLPIQTVNNGDDEIILTDTKEDMNAFKSLRADKTVGHYAVTPEEGQGFSGNLILKTEKDLVYQPRSKVHTPLQKWLIPEHAIGGAHRRYWPIGMVDRVKNLTDSDVGREIWSVTMFGYRKFLSSIYGGFNEVLSDAVGSMDVQLDGFSSVDREVLVDPDKIHYKYLPSEISTAALDKISANIPTERVETVCSMLYRGNYL